MTVFCEGPRWILRKWKIIRSWFQSCFNSRKTRLFTFSSEKNYQLQRVGFMTPNFVLFIVPLLREFSGYKWLFALGFNLALIQERPDYLLVTVKGIMSCKGWVLCSMTSHFVLFIALVLHEFSGNKRLFVLGLNLALIKVRPDYLLITLKGITSCKGNPPFVLFIALLLHGWLVAVSFPCRILSASDSLLSPYKGTHITVKLWRIWKNWLFQEPNRKFVSYLIDVTAW